MEQTFLSLALHFHEKMRITEDMNQLNTLTEIPLVLVSFPEPFFVFVVSPLASKDL